MQFHVLGDIRTDEWTYEGYVRGLKPKLLGEALKCPVCGEWASMLPWLPPYHAEIVMYGPRLGDIVKGVGQSLLVSDRFRKAWIDAELVGIDFFSPIERLRIRPARLKKNAPTYFHVAPRLFDAQIDLEHSCIEYNGPITCAKCKGASVDTARGFAIDEKTWRGEDIFMVWGIYGRIIVSDRVRELRDKHGLTNVNLTPIEDYLWDPEKRWTPYCYYLPDGFTPKAEHEYEYVTEEEPPTN